MGTVPDLVAQLQERTDHGRIAELFDRTGFWSAVAGDPFVRTEWVEAIRCTRKIMTQPAFDPYREDPRFIALEQEAISRANAERVKLGLAEI